MDILTINIENYYANTKKQLLSQHLFAVGYLASQVIKKLNLITSINTTIAHAAFVSGCLHDIGKLDPLFQKWILDKTKKTVINEMPEDGQHIDKTLKEGWFENHPRHNEISVLLYHLLNDENYSVINIANKNSIKHTLYWHHRKPFRKSDSEFKDYAAIYKKLKKNVGDTDFGLIFSAFKQTIKQINDLLAAYSPQSELELNGFLARADENRIDGLTGLNFPSYKHYDNDDYLKNISTNALNNLLRTAVITADRLISQLSREELNQHITEKTLDTILDKALVKERGLTIAIQDCLSRFELNYPNSERNPEQTRAATQLADEEVNIGILRGPAGCGKTKIALEWAMKTNVKKIIWICPRVQVCQGLFNDLTSANYLPNSKIEIYTGEFKQILFEGKPIDTAENELFSGEIVITTIDQVINSITTHRLVDSLISYMDSHIVFDEFHEYITMPAFNLLFAELVECKKYQQENARTLLVSATPNYYFINEFLRLNKNDIIGINSFNQSQYNIEFVKFDDAKADNENPLYQLQPKNTFVISNTAITAQLSFIENQTRENAILFHGYFTKSDKETLFKRVFDNFNEYGQHEYAILRSGPIIQAALNISCDKMVTEMTNAENWLQRLGRLDRFGQNAFVNDYITAIPQSLAISGKQSSPCAKFLNKLHSLQSAKAWYEFLQQELSTETITINELYQLYDDFYNNEKCQKAVAKDLEAAIKNSVAYINSKLLDPIYVAPKSSAKASKIIIKKQSLRGNNRFVQMAVLNIGNGKTKLPNEYAYTENDSEAAKAASLTCAVDVICGYGDREQDLLDFMVKKHHNIKDTENYDVKANTKYKDKIYLNKALEMETPIYLSYTKEDLEKVNAQAHNCSIYYAMGINQAIGAMALNKLELEE